MRIKVGVLALQGAFFEHVKALEVASSRLSDCDTEIILIKKSEELDDQLDGLVIPGGESTTFSTHLAKHDFLEKLRQWTTNPRKFTWGTCAGLILLSNSIAGNTKHPVASIGGLSITCERNVNGRQIDSCETSVLITDKSLVGDGGDCQFPGVFIRPPGIASVDDDTVQVLCRLQNKEQYSVVGVRQNNIIACTFHPELTDDTRWHEYFLKNVCENVRV